MSNSLNNPQFGAMLPPEVRAELIEATLRESMVLTHFRRLRNMTGHQTVLNVRSELPMAGAVNPIGGVPEQKFEKPVTDQKFAPLNMYAGEFAAIKIFRNADLADALSAGHDIIRGDIPMMASQFGAAIDRAVFWGEGKPSEWASVPSLYERATAGGAILEDTGNPFLDIFAEDGAIEKVELSGYEVDGIMGAIRMRAKMQGMTDASGKPYFGDNVRDGFPH